MIARRILPLLVVAATLALGGCATAPPEAFETPETVLNSQPPAGTVLRSIDIDRAAGDRILALDPEHLSEADVRETLAAAPAPQIILLHGGIYPVQLLMVSFGRFLTGMGYPEARIRDPRDKEWSRTPYEDGSHEAGLVAWYYEHRAMRPMLIGHSQGGVQAVKVLHILNGDFGSRVAVWNPLADAAENRATIRDPFTGEERPVVGLSVSYVSVVGAGGAALLLPNQWNMIGRLHSIPDTVEDFTGFTIPLDPVAWAGTTADQYHPNGSATVRNVTLPISYSHVFVPLTHELANDKATRDWINAYTPAAGEAPEPPKNLAQNALWAADVWYSVKKHWCLEAQRVVRAQRAGAGTS